MRALLCCLAPTTTEANAESPLPKMVAEASPYDKASAATADDASGAAVDVRGPPYAAGTALIPYGNSTPRSSLPTASSGAAASYPASTASTSARGLAPASSARALGPPARSTLTSSALPPSPRAGISSELAGMPDAPGGPHSYPAAASMPASLEGVTQQQQQQHRAMQLLLHDQAARVGGDAPGAAGEGGAGGGGGGGGGLNGHGGGGAGRGLRLPASSSGRRVLEAEARSFDVAASFSLRISLSAASTSPDPSSDAPSQGPDAAAISKPRARPGAAPPDTQPEGHPGAQPQREQPPLVRASPGTPGPADAAGSAGGAGAEGHGGGFTGDLHAQAAAAGGVGAAPALGAGGRALALALPPRDAAGQLGAGGGSARTIEVVPAAVAGAWPGSAGPSRASLLARNPLRPALRWGASGLVDAAPGSGGGGRERASGLAAAASGGAAGGAGAGDGGWAGGGPGAGGPAPPHRVSGTGGAWGLPHHRAAVAHEPLHQYNENQRLPYHQASHRMSQVAWQLLQSGGVGGGHVPMHQLASADLTAMCREISGLRWIGQGGGGAVFQGMWQSAPVAVKFMLAEADAPGTLDAAALEGVVSRMVGHPNVVHTYTFECARLTEASFVEQEDDSSGIEFGISRDLLGSLLDSAAHPHGSGSMWGTSGAAAQATSFRRARALAAAAGGPAGGGVLSGFQLSRLGGAAAGALGAARISGAGSVQDDARAAEAGAAGEAAAAAAKSARGSDAGRAGGTAGAHDAAERQQQQQQPEPVRNAVLESTFHSDEGFGDPDQSGGLRGWSVRQVLAHLKARPGMFMTHIIMEHCDRGSLLAAIRRGLFRLDGGAGGGGGTSPAVAASGPHSARFPRRIVLRAILRTARDIAQGMSHLHANGIIHGDLKPGNVLLRGCRTDRRGFVAMVADFGLSKFTRGDKPLEHNHWSTVTVMAPEVILGRWLKASDVFSFGILVWQLVTSEPVPYSRLTVPQILMGVSQGVLKPEWPAGAHPSLVRLGRACLAHSPEKRPSFTAIVKVLTKIEKGVRDELRVVQREHHAGAGRAGAAAQLPAEQ